MAFARCFSEAHTPTPPPSHTQTHTPHQLCCHLWQTWKICVRTRTFSCHVIIIHCPGNESVVADHSVPYVADLSRVREHNECSCTSGERGGWKFRPRVNQRKRKPKPEARPSSLKLCQSLFTSCSPIK